MISYLQALHNELFFFIYGASGYSPVIDNLIRFFAQDIEVYVVAFAMLFLLLHQHHRHVKEASQQKKDHIIIELSYITVAITVAWFVAELMKISFAELRPFELYQNVTPLFVYGGSDSFPSGHATIFSALAMMIYLLHKRVGIIFIFLAILIPVARVMSGIHFPIDIFAGWLIGGGISYLVFRFFYTRKLFRRFLS